MLNAYFEVAIPPVVERHGGDIDRLIGDALMATFNRRGDQPDHPEQAARAALAIQEATGAIAAEHPNWPRFRVGVNTGEALVGVLGTGGGRTHTVVGDTVNVAARLESQAPVGGVALGPATADRLEGARTERLGAVHVKGKDEPIEAHALVALAEGSQGDRSGSR
jgi:adenylate cyclase